MLQAGAGVEELKVRCPYYYTVGRELHSAMQATLTADETFPVFIMNSLRKRYKVGYLVVGQGGRVRGAVALYVSATGPGRWPSQRPGTCRNV